MATINNIFYGQMEPKDVTKYMLARGVVDYSALQQFNSYETGYGFLFVLKIPEFLSKLRDLNDTYKSLIDNYTHVLEYDFRSLSGFEDMTVDTSELNDGINNINVITQVHMQAASQFTMRYYERSGSLITKVHELYLRGIKDPRTQVKRYNGLIETDGTGMTAGYEQEVFQFLYINTDNTVTKIEKAYLIVAAQPQTAELSMYDYSKGEIGWHELNVQFSGYPITGPAITAKGQEFLDWLNNNTIFEDARFGYEAIDKMPEAGDHGTINASSNEASF